MATSLARPLSAGSVHITCADPNQLSIRLPTYLADLEMLATAVELCEKMAAASPLKEKFKRRHNPDESEVS
jgi:hypothetical protein